jgi:hypothetical protein
MLRQNEAYFHKYGPTIQVGGMVVISSRDSTGEIKEFIIRYDSFWHVEAYPSTLEVGGDSAYPRRNNTITALDITIQCKDVEKDISQLGINMGGDVRVGFQNLDAPCDHLFNFVSAISEMDQPDITIFRGMHQLVKDEVVKSKQFKEYATILQKIVERLLPSDHDTAFFSVELGWLYEACKEGKLAVLAYKIGVDVCSNGLVPPGTTCRAWNCLGLALERLEKYDAAKVCYIHVTLYAPLNLFQREEAELPYPVETIKGFVYINKYP